MPSGVTDEVLPSSQPPVDKEETSTGSTPQQGNLSTGSNRDAGKNDEEGVEVVLGDESNPKMVEPPARPRQTPDQNVFRHPQAVRPRAVRAHGHPPHPPPHPHPHHAPSSGSWGYGHPPPPHHEYHPRPYPVPPYNPSGSFDEHGYHRAPHYSPHVSYPPYRPPEDVNVISPSHGDPRYRPPPPPRSRHMPPPNYYHYPPASPISHPSGAPDHSPRMRDYGPRREGPYSKAQRDYHDDRYPPRPVTERSHHAPTVVAESSFDSEHHSRESMSHPTTPASTHHGVPHPPPPPPPPPSHDPHYQFYGGGGSWGSFDSAAGPPPHFDDQRYYGFPPPDSPYGPYNSAYSPGGGLYPSESFPPPPTGYPPHPAYAYSYDEDDRMAHDYHRESREVTPSKKGRSTPKASNKASNNNTLLPKAAEEVDFEVTDPPMSPVTQPSEHAIVESLAEVNTHDVLCGRGGGTNSQIGNRRFRKLVQEFQPTYLLARRKEKPLLARTIVLIIRKRGGRFLKKDDDSGELFEVGDAKAEAKTSQALREGLDVRATKSAASSLLEKKKKKQQQEKAKSKMSEEDSPRSEKDEHSNKSEPSTPKRAESPPVIPRLHGEGAKAGIVHPHSPEQDSFRKRRRTRSAGSSNRFFPDFCPPRADLAYRPASPLGPDEDDVSIALSTTPIRRNNTRDEEDRYADEARGCAGIAFDVVTGAATGSFCLGPTGWRR